MTSWAFFCLVFQSRKGRSQPCPRTPTRSPSWAMVVEPAED